jgi:hypothetical protein
VTNPDDIARAIIAAARARFGVDAKHAAVVGVCTALAESGGLILWANDGSSTLTAVGGRQMTAADRAVARESLNYPHDRVGRNLDSMGLYQQRPMMGWGAPAELMDPAVSAGKFFDGAGTNKGLVDIPGWRGLEPFEAGRRVQGSLPRDAPLYASKQAAAVGIVDRLWPTEDDTTSDEGWLNMATPEDLEAVLDGFADKIVQKVWDKIGAELQEASGEPQRIDLANKVVDFLAGQGGGDPEKVKAFWNSVYAVDAFNAAFDRNAHKVKS